MAWVDLKPIFGTSMAWVELKPIFGTSMAWVELQPFVLDKFGIGLRNILVNILM